jgi:hypothetical protein
MFTLGEKLRRLRLVMAIVMLVDFAVTLPGQPSTYWTNATSGQEFNRS